MSAYCVLKHVNIDFQDAVCINTGLSEVILVFTVHCIVERVIVWVEKELMNKT